VNQTIQDGHHCKTRFNIWYEKMNKKNSQKLQTWLKLKCEWLFKNAIHSLVSSMNLLFYLTIYREVYLQQYLESLKEWN